MSSFLAVAIVYSCIAIASTIAVSASIAAASTAASAISGVAPTDIAASSARFANLAITLVFCVCCASDACLACFYLSASASFVVSCLSSSRFAFHSRCSCISSCVDDMIRCLAKCSVTSLTYLTLFGSCLPSMVRIYGVSVRGSRILPPRELEASETEPSLILSLLPRPDSLLCSSRSG